MISQNPHVKSEENAEREVVTRLTSYITKYPAICLTQILGTRSGIEDDPLSDSLRIFCQIVHCV